MGKNYRNIILAAIAPYAVAGEEMDRALLDGAPEIISRDEALAIADWLEFDAVDDAGWPEKDQARHKILADAIRKAIGA